MKVKPQLDQILEDFRAQCAVLEKEAQQASLTAADAQLVTSQINAVVALVKSLREYLEQTGKLQASDRNRFKAAETALQAIRIKPSPPHPAGRASALVKRVSPPGQKP